MLFYQIQMIFYQIQWKRQKVISEVPEWQCKRTCDDRSSRQKSVGSSGAVFKSQQTSQKNHASTLPHF